MLRSLFVVLLVVVASVAFSQETKIRIGDVLKLTCEEEPTLNKNYTVTSQGIILVDFLGAVHVEGNTEDEAARIVSARLVDGRILRRATITVKILSTSVAPVTYRGAVQATGQEPHTEGLRLADIVRKARPREDTDLSRIEVRSKDGQTQFVDFTRFEPATNANNPLLKPGDTVTFGVKTAPGLVVLLGGVERPGGISWERGMTVRSAIAKAGGFAALGVQTTVRLERRGQAARTLDLSQPGVDATVQEGDRIVVAMKEERLYVTVNGAVNQGGFLEHKPGMTLTQYIEAAKGLRADANPERVKLTRKGESRSVTFSFNELKSGRTTDPVLQPGDKVTVDAKNMRKNDVLRGLTMLALLYILIGR